jgi:hypothetical protein
MACVPAGGVCSVMQRLASVLVLAAVLGVASDGSAQGRQNRPAQNGDEIPPPGSGGRGPVADGASPAEVQRLFDAYVIIQAQQDLGLSDEQYPKFVSRVRALQDLRRRAENERGRILQELRRITSSPNTDDALIKPRLKALDDLEARSATEVRTAMEAVDQVLDLRQQARFRVFEEQMERRKVELLLRARQANRPRQQFQE